MSDYFYDVRDVNKDGYVSSLEELLYELENPGQVTRSTAAGASAGTKANVLSNQQGGLSAVPDATRSAISLFV